MLACAAVAVHAVPQVLKLGVVQWVGFVAVSKIGIRFFTFVARRENGGWIVARSAGGGGGLSFSYVEEESVGRSLYNRE